MANPTSGTLVDCAMVDWVGFRARIIEENISNRIDSNRLFFMNRFESIRFLGKIEVCGFYRETTYCSRNL